MCILRITSSNLSLSLSKIASFSLVHSSPPGSVKPRNLLSKTKMNKFVYRQNALVGFGEISRSNDVVCPKPRKAVEPIIIQEVEGCDLKAGTELLDIILTKGRYDVEYSNFQLDSSPPFFCRSPPSRASNTLIQDAHFGNDDFLPVMSIPESPTPFSSSGCVTGGGCVRVKFGNNSTPVRIEGFNCRGISAVA